MLIPGNWTCFGICSILAYPNYIQNIDSKTEKWKKGFLCVHSLNTTCSSCQRSPHGKGHLRYSFSKDSGLGMKVLYWNSDTFTNKLCYLRQVPLLC